MSDDSATILAEWITKGDEKFLSVLEAISTTMRSQKDIVAELATEFDIEEKIVERVNKRIESFSNILKIAYQQTQAQNKETEIANTVLTKLEDSYTKVWQAEQKLFNKNWTSGGGFEWLTGEKSGKSAAASAQVLAEELKKTDIAANSLANDLNKVNAANLKKVAEEAELGRSAIGRFSLSVAGSAEKLSAMEKNAYNASRQSVLFSQNLIAHPITTLKAFAASAEKAAIAGDYFRQQLAFIAGSRFGSIVILGGLIAGVEESLSKAVDAAKEFDTTMRQISRYIAAEGIGAEEAIAQAVDLAEYLQQLSLAFGVSLKDLGSMAERLKGAGLELETIKQSISEFAKFKISFPEVDVNEFTKSIIGLMNATKDMTGFRELSSDGERLKKILNELTIASAAAVYEPKDIPVFLSHLTSLATVAGILPEQILAIEGTLTALGIKAATAGRLTRGLLVTLSETKKIDALEKMGVYIDHTKTLGEQLMNILTQIAEISKMDMSGAMDIEALKAFSDIIPAQRLSVLAALLKDANSGWREYNKQIQQIEGASGALDRSAAQMNESLVSQKQILLNTLSAIAQNVTSSEALSEVYRGLTLTVKGVAVPFLTVAASLKDIGYLAGGSAIAVVGLYDAIAKASTGDFEGAKLALSIIETAIADTGKAIMNAGEEYQTTIKNLFSSDFSNYLDKTNAGLKKNTAEINIATQAVKAQSQSFVDLLSNEEKYRLGLSEEGNYLQAKIEKTRILARGLQEEALRQAAINANSKEYQAVKEKAITAQENLNNLISKQKETERQIVDAVQEYVEKIASTKILSPLQQMQDNLKQLELTVQRLNDARVGTAEWAKSMKDVGDKTILVAENMKIAEAVAQKASRAFSDFISAESERARALAQGDYQQKRQAEEALLSMQSQAEMAVWIAKTSEQRLAADNELLKVYTQMQESGRFDERIQAKINETMTDRSDILKEIADKAQKENEGARVLAEATGATRDQIEMVRDSFQETVVSIEDAAKALGSDFNPGLAETNIRLQEINQLVIDLANRIRSMPKLDIGGGPGNGSGLELEGLEYRGWQ